MVWNLLQRLTARRAPAGKRNRRSPLRFESLEDRSLLATIIVDDYSGGSGPGTLRAAIDQANTTPAFDTIIFNDVPQAPPRTIVLGGALPPITTEMEINGTTHPAYSAGVPAITVDGINLASIAPTSDGFVVDFAATSANALVRIKGLAITRFPFDGMRVHDLPDLYDMEIADNWIFNNGDDGISVDADADFDELRILSNLIALHTNINADQGANGIEINDAPVSVSIEDNWIGTDGSIDLGNRDSGIFIEGRAEVTISNGNVISGNNGYGIHAVNLTEGISIFGNAIGLDETAQYDVGNTSYGIVLEDSSGGSHSIYSNFIGGNGGGIRLDNVDGVQVGASMTPNLIGLAADFTTPVGNDLHGIELLNGTHDTTIENNYIVFNGQDGVSLQANAGNDNRITSNVIYGNSGLGIDLYNDGVTLNDANDADSGPNHRLNFPVMSINRLDGAVWYIDVNYAANSKYGSHKFDFEFYANPTADVSGYGEGLGFPSGGGKVQATLSGSGTAAFTKTVTVNAGQGTWLSALAIDRGTSGTATYGDTSEFARNLSLIQGDLNQDGAVTLADLSILVSNYGKASGATWYEGDLNNDDKVNVKDLFILRNDCDCDGGESLMGGGGGGGEEMTGGGGEEMLGGGEEMTGGGGESLLSENPARIYITISGSTSGGGALPGSVPSVLLDGPEDTVTLYVWANLDGYEFLNGYGLDIRATDEDVVKATASTLYNADIVASNYGNAQIGVRWDGNLTQPALNPGGIGGEMLAEGAAVFTLTSGGGLNSAYDGSDFLGSLDELYDTTNAAFLVQSITLEALSGSSGLSTDIVLYVGDMAFSLDNTVDASYLTFGLGEEEVANNAVGESDGTTHATITVASQGPSALVMRATAASSAERTQSYEASSHKTPVQATPRRSATHDRRVASRQIDGAFAVGQHWREERRAVRDARTLAQLPIAMPHDETCPGIGERHAQSRRVPIVQGQAT